MIRIRESLAFMLDLIEDLSIMAQASWLESARQMIKTTPVDFALLVFDLAGERGLHLIHELWHPGAIAFDVLRPTAPWRRCSSTAGLRICSG